MEMENVSLDPFQPHFSTVDLNVKTWKLLYTISLWWKNNPPETHPTSYIIYYNSYRYSITP